MKLLTQTELLNELNKYVSYKITKQAFYDRVRRGQIKIHYKSTSKKKFYKFHEVCKIYNINIDVVENNTPNQIRDNKDLYNSENLSELNTLLSEATSSLQRVTIIKHYWNAKTKEREYYNLIDSLIPKKEALEVFEIGIRNLEKEFKKIPLNTLNMSIEMAEYIKTETNKAFQAFIQTTQKI